MGTVEALIPEEVGEAHTRTHAHTHARTHAHTQTHTQIHTQRTYTDTDTHRHTHTHTHTPETSSTEQRSAMQDAACGASNVHTAENAVSVRLRRRCSHCGIWINTDCHAALFVRTR